LFASSKRTFLKWRQRFKPHLVLHNNLCMSTYAKQTTQHAVNSCGKGFFHAAFSEIQLAVTQKHFWSSLLKCEFFHNNWKVPCEFSAEQCSLFYSYVVSTREFSKINSLFEKHFNSINWCMILAVFWQKQIVLTINSWASNVLRKMNALLLLARAPFETLGTQIWKTVPSWDKINARKGIKKSKVWFYFYPLILRISTCFSIWFVQLESDVQQLLPWLCFQCF